jgi:hypothetical protein
LQRLKGRRNTKIIIETERKYQIAKAEGKTKYPILHKRKTKYLSKKKIKSRFIKSALISC